MSDNTENVRRLGLFYDEPEYAHTPFHFEGNPLGSLREDQMPRFLGALTDTESLPVMAFPLNNLLATQNRVDVAKVEAIRTAGAQGGKRPLVVLRDGRNYLTDGHHRATAAWLNGDESIEAHYIDLNPVTEAVKLFKVDDSLGLVFGWAIISKLGGQDYWDRQNHHIPEDVMLDAAARFMQGDAIIKEMHKGEAVGRVVFAWPLTEEIAKSMGISCHQSGLMVAMRPDNSEMLEKFRDGTYSGFSIGGRGEMIEQ